MPVSIKQAKANKLIEKAKNKFSLKSKLIYKYELN